ncbi:MAG: hypothetical protein RL596_990 [Bacteroidota bacterium]|jgi:phosphopantetheinyl transferase
MPLYYQQNINETTRLGVWEITEPLSFFLEKVSLNLPVSHPHKQLQHLAGRYLLTVLFPDFPVELIAIADTRKPYLPAEQYHFSISHCGRFAAAIVSSDKRVGIDIENITERVHKIKHKYLNSSELKAIANFRNQTDILTLLWSCKEAMFKWWGRGELDFRQNMHIEFSLASDDGQTPFFDLSALFQKENFGKHLTLNCYLNKELSLVWLVTQAF